MRNETDKGAVNVGRHRRSCTICAHAKCADVEADFVNWESPAKLAEQYGLADRTTVYRHAHALGLFEKRKRNVRAALERIIEKSGEVEVTASAVVAAIPNCSCWRCRYGLAPRFSKSVAKFLEERAAEYRL